MEYEQWKAKRNSPLNMKIIPEKYEWIIFQEPKEVVITPS